MLCSMSESKEGLFVSLCVSMGPRTGLWKGGRKRALAGAHFRLCLGGAGPAPGARPAQFVARQNTEDENLASIDAGEVLLPRRARIGVIGRRAQGPQGLILLEEPPIETKRTPPPFLSGFLFPATHPMFQKRKATRIKFHSDRLNFPGVWLTTEIGDLEPCLP